nr:hypothetical protein Iba_chr08bCG2890 [Ipomoea batatas]
MLHSPEGCLLQERENAGGGLKAAVRILHCRLKEQGKLSRFRRHKSFVALPPPPLPPPITPELPHSLHLQTAGKPSTATSLDIAKYWAIHWGWEVGHIGRQQCLLFLLPPVSSMMRL